MKKWQQTGKKALSVFMAIMMLMTAWVWVAPTEASAVTSGSYSYQLIAHVDNDFDSNASGYFTIYAKANNGTDSTRTPIKSKVAIDEDIFKGSDKRGTDVVLVSGTSTSFPCAFDFYSYKTSLFIGVGQLTIYLKVKVGNEWSTVCYEQTNAQQGQGEVETSAEAASTNYPTPSTIEWVSANTDDLIISDDADVNKTMTFRVLDQYGVRMSSTALTKLNASPEVKVSGTQSGNLDTDSSKDIYYTFSSSSSASYSVTVTATTAAKSKIYNKQEITVGATAGSLSLTDKVFVLHDPKYTVSFNKNASDASAMSPASYSVYYGESLASQATLDKASTYPTGGTRVGYTFLGMYDAATGGNLMNVNAEVTANKTYYAHWEILKYAAVFMDRSGDNVVLVQSDIPHGSAATEAAEAALKLSKIEYDDANHYTLNESDVWNPTTNAVTGNTFFYPNYISSAHTLDSGTAIEATCQHGAGVEYKCTGCDYSYVEESSTTLGEHVKSDSYIVDTEATCTATGSGHYYCTVCGATVETVTIPANGHSFKSEIIKAATCKETGIKKYSCTNCDHTEEETIPLTQHNYVAGETVAATCASSAYTPFTCSCGASYNKYEGNATTNHNWSFTVSDVTANNTKVVAGTCSVCGATFEKEVELPATHNFTNIVITKQPTCKTEGEITISCADSGCTENYTATLPIVSTAHAEYTTTYTPAECGKAGSVVTICKTCGAKISKTEIEALNHSYNYVRIEPTCTTAGSITKTCANCGDVQTEAISATGHKTVTVDANCQHGGYVKCGVCDTVISETPKAAHDFSGEVKEVSATCTVDGIRFTKCKNCDAQIADILSKTGHNIPNDFTVIIPATCEGKGYQTKTCSKCNVVLESEEIDKLGHNHQKSEKDSVVATCTEPGEDVYVCSRCGDINTTVINPTGHKWNAGTTTAPTCTNGGYITYTCENANCNETKLELINGSAALMHDFTGDVTIVKSATCEEDGEKTVKCSRCDATTTVVIPHLGHTWGKWTVTKEATNTTPGEMTRTCSNGICIETVEIPAGGHNSWDKDTEIKSATCSEEGTMVYKCTSHTDCGVTIEVSIPVKQHTVAQKIVEATCTATGKVMAYCSVCDADCAKPFSTVDTPVKAHNPVKGETVAPTCTTSGYTEYACECDTFSYKEYDASKPATGHLEWTKTDEKAATCTEDGYINYECSACKAPKEEILPKTGHSFTENKAKATAATCTSLATKTYECACGASYVEYYGELAAHNYNILVKTVPATNDSLGYEEYKCACGLTKITILEATGTHVFNEKITDECVAPTCTENGIEVYKCSAHDNCGVKSSVLVPRLGHTAKAVYNAPTCKAAGSSAAYCTTCRETINSIEIPATGIHNWNEGVETTAPTCEGEGVKTYTCSVCSETKTAAIPAKGHDLSTTVVDATCEADGTVEITCSRCDDTDVEKTINLTKKNHDWNEGVETTAPTCEEEGVKTYTCLVCDAEKTEAIPAKGHTWGDWEVTPSTNSAKGSVSRSCLICGAKETVDIPAGNHKLVVDTEKSTSASCNAKGKTVFKCENHDNCGITLEFTTEMTQHSLVTETKDATCTEKGEVITRCEKCNNVSIVTEIPAKGHAYNNVSVKDATCTEDGVRTYTCACGDSRTEAIPAKGHSYKTTVTPATCTAPGSVVTECTVCHSDEAKTVTAIPVMGHDYAGVETLIKSADCETDGSKTVKCSRCDVTTTVILPKFGHNYSDWEETPATNDTDGSWYHKCSTCGKEETLTIPAGGHNLVETENVHSKCNEKGHITYKCNAHENCSVTVTVELDYAQHTILKDNVDATCTDNGHSITYCKECGVKFNDFDIPAKGHIYEGQPTLPATCIKEGVMTYTCSKCNDSYTVSVPMTQHTYEAGEEVKATCTTRGYIPYSCTTSGCTSGYEFLTEEAKGHTYKQTVSSSTCTKGGKVTLECECGDTIEADVPALGHAYALSATTAADCTATATETYTCSRCDASYTVSVGDKAEHTFSEWKVIAEATENTLGYKTRSCTKCGKIELEKIDAIGDHKFDKFISETPATCTDPGETVYECSTHDDCGLTSTVVIPALGHDMVETAAAVVPTCDSDGTTAVFTCKNGCGTFEGGEKIAALGHIYGEGEVTPATCKDEGKIVYTCGRCGGTHTAVIETNENAHQYETTVTDATCTKEGTVIAKCKLCGNETLNKPLPKLEHTWSVDKTTPATCDTDGTTYYKCSCGATKETAIPKLGHRMTAGLSVDATCTENGYTPYTCTNSGCTYTYNVYNAPAIAHNYVQVENSSTADCVNGGTVTLRCSECDKEITAAVPALGHDWGEWTTTKNPTAADEGEVERSCKRDGCNATETVPLPALGHEMVKDEVNSTAATCTAEGRDVYVCKTHTDCGYTYYVKTSKLAHDYDEGTVTEKATCTTDGEKTYTCKCGATVTELIPKTAHTLSTAVTEATCQVQGSVVTSCADCEYEIKTDLGYGVHKLTVVRESEPDCETKGIITVKCSETGCTHIADTIELPATGHDWSGEESDIVPATCETDGSKKVKCLHCEETTTVVIPATGHNYAEGESFAATCITSGYTVFACDCGSSYSRLDSQPNGHSWDEGTVKTPADCVNEGIILVKCENCEASYEKTVSKLCHSWGAWVTTKYPTASEEGEMTRACIRGGCDATETAVIPALGGGNVSYTVTFVADGEVVAVQTVNHGSDATAPVISKASDANGHYSYIWDTDFTNVTDNLTVTAIFTLAGHTYGSWVTDRESTCQANGSQHRSCTVCGYTETASLTLADHNYSVVVGEKAPTCTENGYKDVVCSVCGKAEKQIVKRLGHIMTYHERVYETCDTDGSLAYYECSVCGKKYADRIGNTELIDVVVRKKYHTFVVVEGSAATCTSDGKTDYRHCTTCGLNQPSETIPALGHVDVNNDHICDRCSGTYMEGGQIVCTCNCHKVGFFNELIYKILRFFWKLMGSNKTCACGAIHY